MSYKTIGHSLKITPVAAISVNHYFLSKAAEHDVTLKSITADLF